MIHKFGMHGVRTVFVEKRSLVSRLDALRDATAAKVRRTVRQAVLQTLAHVDREGLQHSIASGASGLWAAVNLDIQWASEGAAILSENLPPLLGQAASAAAKVYRAQFVHKADVGLTNPKILQWAQQRAAELVSGITEDTAVNIRRAIVRGLDKGWSVKRIADAVEDVVGLRPEQAEAVERYRAQLEAQGLSQERADRQSSRYADQLLRSRAEAIAQTETSSATARGREALWEEELEHGAFDPKEAEREWSTAPGACEKICEPMSGQAVPWGMLFLTGDGRRIAHEPAHPNCRCLVLLNV